MSSQADTSRHVIVLDHHDGYLGTSAWVLCHECTHDPTQAGWFAIRAGEHHWWDREHYKSYHAACGLALVDAGRAVIRDLPMVKAAS